MKTSLQIGFETGMEVRKNGIHIALLSVLKNTLERLKNFLETHFSDHSVKNIVKLFSLQ